MRKFGPAFTLTSETRSQVGRLFFRPIVFLRTVLDVPIEPDRSSLFPILRIVFINAGAMPQEAVKLAARRIDHNPHVSAPDYQVTRLRLLYSTKIIGAAVEIGRTGIRIGEARPLINGMHQV